MLKLDKLGLNEDETKEVEKLLTDNLCMTFEPNGKGEEFINMVASGKYPFNTLSAGNDCQKTAVMIQIIISLVYKEPLNKWFEKPFFKNFKYPCKLRIGSTPTAIEKKIIPELKKWLPKGTYKTFKGRKAFESTWTFEGGSVLDILTYEQEIGEWESVDLDGIFLDEPSSEAIFNACIARMREKIFMVLTLTPLLEADWMVDKTEDPQWGFIYADMFDNCKCCGIRGIREHKAIQEKIDAMDPDEKEARAHGKFMCLAGVIFKMFNREVHCIKRCQIQKDWVLGLTIDPHPAKPFAMSWWAVTNKSELIFIEEFPKEDFESLKRVSWTVQDYYNFIRNIESDFPSLVKYRYIDPNYGRTPDVIEKRTVIQEFSSFGMHFNDDINDDINEGILAIKNRLRYDTEKEISGSNQPTLFFFDDLRNHIKHMSKWGYREWKYQKGKSMSERTQDKFKDFVDCIRYTCIKDPIFSMPKGGEYKRYKMKSRRSVC